MAGQSSQTANPSEIRAVNLKQFSTKNNEVSEPGKGQKTDAKRFSDPGVVAKTSRLVETASQRRSGTVGLSREAFMHALGQRGISGSELARRAGITPETFNRAMRGYRVYPRTARRLMDALKAIRVAEGSEVLLDGNGHEDKMVGGTHGDQPSVVHVIKARRPLWPDEGVPPAFVNGLPVIDLTPKPKRKPAAPSP